MVAPKLDIPHDKLADFAKRWKINRIELFGSALRDDFGPHSDVDLIADFDEDAPWSVLDHVMMEEDLTAIFGRRVDLVSRKAIDRSRNWIRKREILGTARPIYGG